MIAPNASLNSNTMTNHGNWIIEEMISTTMSMPYTQINQSVKRNLDMLGVFIMLSDHMGHTIEVMQQVYMHLFPNIQSKVVDIMNDLDIQEQKQDQKQD